MRVSLSIYLDQRRKKSTEKYPLKLRVYYSNETRYYLTGTDLTAEEFEKSYLCSKPKLEFKELKMKISGLEGNAKKILDNIVPFSFEKFEKQMFRSSGAGTDVFYHYSAAIEQYYKEERVNTASSYEQSLNSIKGFISSRGSKVVRLEFSAITPQFLKEYEKWMLSLGRQNTTVGIYLRPLRAIFNSAITEGEITTDLYPFGKRKYTIPAGRNVKKALTKEELKKLISFELCEDSKLEKARDFWFFSYVCSGMNIRDIANLNYNNIDGNSLTFIRSKTKNTTKGNTKPIIVSLTDHARRVIEKYSNKRITANTYVFPILNNMMNEKEKVRAVQTFTRFINQHMKKLAENVDINKKISTYWARHTFTTISIQHGASMEFIQDSLGHSSMLTTMNYWKGFEINAKKGLADQLMDF